MSNNNDIIIESIGSIYSPYIAFDSNAYLKNYEIQNKEEPRIWNKREPGVWNFVKYYLQYLYYFHFPSISQEHLQKYLHFKYKDKLDIEKQKKCMELIKQSKSHQDCVDIVHNKRI